jgi:hypothetical protein
LLHQQRFHMTPSMRKVISKLDFPLFTFTLAPTMSASITSLTPKVLRKAANLQEKILSLQKKLNEVLGTPASQENGAVAPKRKKLSARAIANIRAGAKKRWAKVKGKSVVSVPGRKRRRKMSAAGRARLSAMAKARWKRAKADGKSKL